MIWDKEDGVNVGSSIQAATLDITSYLASYTPPGSIPGIIK